MEAPRRPRGSRPRHCRVGRVSRQVAVLDVGRLAERVELVRAPGGAPRLRRLRGHGGRLLARPRVLVVVRLHRTAQIPRVRDLQRAPLRADAPEQAHRLSGTEVDRDRTAIGLLLYLAGLREMVERVSAQIDAVERHARRDRDEHLVEHAPVPGRVLVRMHELVGEVHARPALRATTLLPTVLLRHDGSFHRGRRRAETFPPRGGRPSMEAIIESAGWTDGTRCLQEREKRISM